MLISGAAWLLGSAFFTSSRRASRTLEERLAELLDERDRVPLGVSTGKTTLTIRFDAPEGSSVPPVFAVRTIRA